MSTQEAELQPLELLVAPRHARDLADWFVWLARA